MRGTTWLLWMMLAACSSEAPAPPTPAATAPSAPAPAPAGGPATAAAATATGAPTASSEAPARAATAILQRAAAAQDPAAVGNAPTELAALGAGALPALETALRSGDLRTRRIAVLALLQMGPTALPVAATLDHVAQHDADLDIRAVAVRARMRATSDTSELDAARAAMEAAERANR